MIGGLEVIVANLGVPMSTIYLVVFGIAGIVFYAKDFILGIVMHELIFAALFMWFYIEGWSWAAPLSLFLICFIIMAMTLYAVNKNNAAAGGFV